MKKVLIILTLLFFIAPQYTNTFAITQAQYYEKTILNEFKRNEKIQLSEEELKEAIKRTKDELYMLRSDVIAQGYQTTHKCYPNSVIKQISIYTVDRVVNYYFDAYGKRIGNIEYYYKDNALADASLYPYSSLAQAYESNSCTSNDNNKTQTSSNKIHHIGGIYVSYEGDKIRRIGDMYVSYEGDKIRRIGDMYVSY